MKRNTQINVQPEGSLTRPHLVSAFFCLLVVLSACSENTDDNMGPMPVVRMYDAGESAGDDSVEPSGGEPPLSGGAESVAGGSAGGEAGSEAGDPAGGEAGAEAGSEAGTEAGTEAGNPAGGATSGPSCGDLVCDDAEDCLSCEADCGVCPATRIVINEVVAKALDGGEDWVELYNVGSVSADLSGWGLEDADANLYTIPEVTTLEPGARLFVQGDELGFGLGKDDSLVLKDELGEIVDSTSWVDGEAPEGSSWARIPDGEGDFITTATPTPSAPNQLSDQPAPLCGDMRCDSSEDCSSCAADCGSCGDCLTELLISEYVEGSSNNKAIEIYNGTGADVDLSDYEIWKVTNGGFWPASTTTLEGVIPSGGVVVLCNNNIDAAVADVCDQFFGSDPINFNGDDALGIARSVNGEFTLVDQIGAEGADVGTGWAVAGVANATQNHTLVRAPAARPSTDWASSAAQDWEVLEMDDLSGLGEHTSALACGAP